MFNRKLNFILFGNKGTGKTTLAKILTNGNLNNIESTKEIKKFFGLYKLESSKQSSFLTFERYRKYKLSIIDVPGSFEDRRLWRDSFKKGKKPFALCLIVDPFQSIPETQSALEEVYNRYLESISKDIEKADYLASKSSLLIVIVMNHFLEKGEFNEDAYYNSTLNETLSIIRKKIPYLLVDTVKVDLNNVHINYHGVNAIVERIKRFYYDQNI